MITARPLERLFGGSRSAVLQVLLEVSDGLSVRQISRLANISATTASDALQLLERLHFVERTDVGGSHIYKVAEGNAIVPHLRQILAEAHGIDRDFGRIVTEMFNNRKMLAVILYGSTARVEADLASDVDILLVADDVDIEEWTPMVESAERRLGQYIGRPVHIIVTEWPTAADTRNAFWKHIKSDGRVLSGSRAKELVGG